MNDSGDIESKRGETIYDNNLEDNDSGRTASDENSTLLNSDDEVDKEFLELSNVINLNDDLQSFKSNGNQNAAYRNSRPISLSSKRDRSYFRTTHETKDIREKFTTLQSSSYSKTFSESREIRKFHSVS